MKTSVSMTIDWILPLLFFCLEKTGGAASEVSAESSLQHVQQIAALKQCVKQKDMLLGAHNSQIVKLRDEVSAFKGLKEKAETLALGIFEAKKQLSSVERERDQAKEQLEVNILREEEASMNCNSMY